jgi:ankyrin repeat protein
VVKFLIDGDDVEADSKDNDGSTLLSWAAYSGHEVVVKLLADRDDIDADSKDNRGRTPLSLMFVGGHEAVVKLLAAGTMSTVT